MSNKRPNRGSLAYSPRKRVNKKSLIFSSYRFPKISKVSLVNYFLIKVGMKTFQTFSEIFLQENRRKIVEEITFGATACLVPKILIIGIEYRKNNQKLFQEYFKKPKEMKIKLLKILKNNKKKVEYRKDYDDIRGIGYLDFSNINWIHRKNHQVSLLLTGNLLDRLSFLHQNNFKYLQFFDYFQKNEFIDVLGITKGKGFSGVIKRYGVRRLSHKNSKKRRAVGNQGTKSPGYTRGTIGSPGQLGYFRRTELNKKILPFHEEKLNPNDYLYFGKQDSLLIFLKGSLPGGPKSLFSIRKNQRPNRKNFEKILKIQKL